MGVSDRHYFAWLEGALARFEEEAREFAATGARSDSAEFWVLAGARTNPAVERVRDALGARTRVRFFDRFERRPDVAAIDINALDAVAADQCDVMMMTRASYLLEDPFAFLHHAQRILRPGGLLVIDWLHGASARPALDLPGCHEYDGRVYPFLTTYCDAAAVAEFTRAFGGLVRHLGAPTLAARLRGALGGTSCAAVTLATYQDALRVALARAGKCLVEPDALAPMFKPLFRDACYLYPVTKKHYLYLLTVLRPVGK